MNDPSFILGMLNVRFGTAKCYTMHLKHSRESFKPTRLYAHLPEPQAFIVEKVEWGIHGCEHILAPFDLYEFGMTQQGVELALPTLEQGEGVTMVINYTGRILKGCEDGAPYSLPIVWAEPGASLLKSQNCTLLYSVE